MDWITSVADWMKRNWPRPEGLAVLLVLGTAGLLPVLQVASIGGPWALGSIGALWICIFTIWIWFRRIKRTKHGKLGFVVSIRQEPGTSPAIRDDFILALKRELDASPSAQAFQVTIVPEYLAEKIGNADDARVLRAKLRAHFVLVGRVRHRKLKGGVDHEIVDLIGLVSHGPISDDRAQRLKKEFTELLPSRYQMKSIDSFPGIEFTATWAGLIAKYIIGMAAGLSGDLDYAEKLFLEVQGRLMIENQGILFYGMLRKRVPENLKDIAQAKVVAGTSRWFQSKSEEDLKSLEFQLADAERRSLSGPALDITNAIVAFFRSRDTRPARQYLSRFSKKGRDAVWHLNLAFLDAYDGNLQSAAQHYRKAVDFGVPANDVDITVGQVEHWLLWQLEIEPRRVELYFCLGYVNLNLKGDRIQARRDFEEFMKYCPADKHVAEKELIRKWIPELRAN